MGIPIKTISISVLNSIFSNVVLNARAVSAADEISCYGVNELVYDQQHLCPGSKTCCGTDDQCQQDTRLCSRPNGQIVRGPCYGTPDLKYDFENCAQICIINETISSGLFPRVTQCENGSFCCDYQGNHCCKNGLGVFIQNGLLANTSDVQVPNNASTATDNDSRAYKIGLGAGLGLGLPLVLLVSGLVVWTLIRRRSKKKKFEEPPVDASVPQDASSPKVETFQERSSTAYSVPLAELSTYGSQSLRTE